MAMAVLLPHKFSAATAAAAAATSWAGLNVPVIVPSHGNATVSSVSRDVGSRVEHKLLCAGVVLWSSSGATQPAAPCCE